MESLQVAHTVPLFVVALSKTSCLVIGRSMIKLRNLRKKSATFLNFFR